jgi:hypothetical protein
MPFDQKVQAIQIIVNIQTMQEKIYKRRFSFEEFQGNTLDELRELQNNLIDEWNNAIKN